MGGVLQIGSLVVSNQQWKFYTNTEIAEVLVSDVCRKVFSSFYDEEEKEKNPEEY